MSKISDSNNDEMRAEYDFASMKGGVRGKYAARLRKGTNLALMCQKHPLKFAESPDLQGSEANEAASLKFIVSEVSDGPTEVRWSLPSRGFRRKPSPRNDTSRLALLEPANAEAFPSDAAVNEALRGVLNTTKAVQRSGGLPNKALQPTSRSVSHGKKKVPRRAARG